MSTTDFESWLDAADPDGTEEVYALYDGVLNEEGDGLYSVTRRGDQVIVGVGHVDDKLVLASPKAKSAFLRCVRDRYMNSTNDEDWDAESWYGFQRNMDNPKA